VRAGLTRMLIPPNPPALLELGNHAGCQMESVMRKLYIVAMVGFAFTQPAMGQGNGNGNGNGPNFGGNQTQTQGQGQVQGQGQRQSQNAFGGTGVGIGGAGGAGGTGVGLGGAGGAGGAAGAGGQGGSSAGGAGGSGAGGAGGSASNSGVNVNNSSNYPSGPGSYPASAAYAPSFAVGSACQEAFSLGGSIFFAGVSGGRVYTLDFCKAMMKADYFRKNGQDDVARASECKFAEFRALYKETGKPCREDFTKEQFAAERAATVTPPARQGYIGPNGYVPYPAGYVPN
jgi:hypothetical protein